MSDTIYFTVQKTATVPMGYGATSHLRSHQVGRVTTTVYVSCCQAVQILLLQRSCMPHIVSSVTPPCIKKYIHGQDPLVLCVSAFFKLYCWVALGRQSSDSLTRLKRILFLSIFEQALSAGIFFRPKINST